MIDVGDELNSKWGGDQRLGKRLGSIGRKIAESPAKSFPKIFTESDELEAFYRFLRNENVSWQEILGSHMRRTCERIDKEEEILSISDTTLFSFNREDGAEDIGYIGMNKSQGILKGGFLGHFALAVTSSGKPLGVVGLEAIRRKMGEKKRRYKKNMDNTTRESRKWWDLVVQVRANIKGRKVIHIMDSEGDIYELLSRMIESKERFVVRMSKDRLIESDSVRTVCQALNGAETVTTREIAVSSRKKHRIGKSNRHQARERREARLLIRATTIEVKCPKYRKSTGLPSTLKLNVVHVFEQNCPEDSEPIDWKLLTTEPIENQEQILKVVDFYRRRWMIEEFFKALKTGCGFEKRELQSFKTLLNALAITIPIAYRLLLIREFGRTRNKAPASDILSDAQIRILKSETKKIMSEAPTVEEALLAIARLGGHIKQNGPPGWIVLGRGYEELIILERGYALATVRYQREQRDM